MSTIKVGSVNVAKKISHKVYDEIYSTIMLHEKKGSNAQQFAQFITDIVYEQTEAWLSEQGLPKKTVYPETTINNKSLHWIFDKAK